MKTLIYGRNAIFEAVQANKLFEKVFVQSSIDWSEFSEISKYCKERNITVQKVPVQKLNRLTGRAHQGVVAFLSLIKYYDINDVLMQCYEQGKTPFILVLDGVTDVRNFGAIARSAFCFEVDLIVIPQKGSAFINADAMNASAGALNQIKVAKVNDLMTAINEFKRLGLTIAAATGESTTYLEDLIVKEPIAIIMGDEGKGVSKKMTINADVEFSIHQSYLFDSLNVSVSAGIIMHHVHQKRL